MALTPQNEDAFLREVDENLRRDRLMGLWRRWGIAAIAGVVLALAALGGFLWWQHRQRVTAGESGEALVRALDDMSNGRADRAAPPLAKLATEGKPGYRAAARMAQAAAKLAKDDVAGATADYRAIAGDGEVAQPWRDLATIRWTALDFDTVPPADIVRRLAPLAVQGNPWFGSAGELTALAHIKAGQPERARPLLTAIGRDATVPLTLRERAARLAGSMGAPASQGRTGS